MLAQKQISILKDLIAAQTHAIPETSPILLRKQNSLLAQNRDESALRFRPQWIGNV